MDNKKLFYLLLISVGIIILAFIFLLTKMVKVNSECINNPYVYAVQHTTTSMENENLLCSCQSISGESFYFDKEGVYEEHPYLNKLGLGN